MSLRTDDYGRGYQDGIIAAAEFFDGAKGSYECERVARTLQALARTFKEERSKTPLKMTFEFPSPDEAQRFEESVCEHASSESATLRRYRVVDVTVDSDCDSIESIRTLAASLGGTESR